MPGAVLDIAIIVINARLSCLLSLQAYRLWKGGSNKIVKLVIVESKVQGAMSWVP